MHLPERSKPETFLPVTRIFESCNNSQHYNWESREMKQKMTDRTDVKLFFFGFCRLCYIHSMEGIK
jgi:hypothetical protein